MSETDHSFFKVRDELMDIGIKHLYYFIVTADEGNITHAAQRLYISQPTLSKYIMALEEKLGMTLFHRGERTLTLSRQGKFFYARWRGLLLTVQADFEQGKLLDGVGVDTLRLGCFPVLNFHRYLRAYTDNLSFRHPDVAFDMTSGDYAELLDRLNSRQLDVIFLPTADLPENLDSYEYHVVSSAPLAAVVSVSHMLSSRSSLSPTQLSRQVILMAEPSGRLSRREQHIELLAQKGIRPANIRCVGNYLTAYTEAEHDRGIALGIRSVFPSHNDRVRLIDVAGLTLEIAAVWSKNASEEMKGLIRTLWTSGEG